MQTKNNQSLKTRRILCVLLTLVLMVSLMPMIDNPAYAATPVTWSGGTQSTQTISESTDITVTGEVTIEGQITISGSDTVVTISGGGMLKRGFSGTLIRIQNGSSLILDNITIDGNKAIYTTNVNEWLVYIFQGGLEMNDGAVLQNNAIIGNNNGSGIFVGNGTFDMKGGEIKGNSILNTSGDANGTGGGVCVGNSNGKFNMSGGTISNNTAYYGSGVTIPVGTFEMTGGVIFEKGIAAISSAITSSAVFNSGTLTNNGGVILAWNGSGDIFSTGDTVAGLNSDPTGATAKWANSGTLSGMNYTIGESSPKFMEVAGVTVSSGVPTIYTASIDPANKTFASVKVGYGLLPAQSFSIKNTGTGTITGLSATLTTDTSFEISAALSTDSVGPGDAVTVSVQPKAGLIEGIYTDKLMISGSNGISISADLSFTVIAGPTYDAPLDFVNTPLSPSIGTGYIWNTTTKTLTLNGFNIDCGGEDAINLPDGSSIVLAANSNNRISSLWHAIVCQGSFEIRGDGNLTTKSNEAIKAEGNLTINGGFLDFTSTYNFGLKANNIMIKGGSGTIKAAAGSAVYTQKITLGSNTTNVTVMGLSSSGYNVATKIGAQSYYPGYEFFLNITTGEILRDIKYTSTTISSSGDKKIDSIKNAAFTLKVTGTYKVGKKLKATITKPANKKQKYTYQWLRNGKAIKGSAAKKATYKLTKADKGKKISVKVKSKASGWTSVIKTSKAKKVK